MTPLKTYTVALLEWDVYYLDVEATSPEAAILKAQANRETEGLDDWRHTNGGDDGYEVIDEREVRP